MPFHFEQLDTAGAVLITPRVFPDGRGYFMETYKRSEFEAAGIGETFVQENHSRSSKGVLRGLHLQREPKSQAKLVEALQGEIFDVFVDLRPGSPGFGRWQGVVLSDQNKQMLYVPPWCAHGFCVLSDEAHIRYKVTAEYAPEAEAGIIWDDPDLAIQWPLTEPILSPRDQTWPTLAVFAAAAAAMTGGQIRV